VFYEGATNHEHPTNQQVNTPMIVVYSSGGGADPIQYVGPEKRTVTSYPQDVVLFGNSCPQTVRLFGTHRKSLSLSVTLRKLFLLKVTPKKNEKLQSYPQKDVLVLMLPTNKCFASKP